LADVFSPLNDLPELVAGLRHFLSKVAKGADVAGSKQDRETIEWGCKVAQDSLKVLGSVKKEG
jgi:nucleolar MIF4G domain-containing protein 1